LKGVLKSDMENIRPTMEKIDYETFDAVVNSIFEAKRIFIIGLRSSMALAEFLEFYLNLILQNVKTVGSGISDIFEQMVSIRERDLVIGMGLPRDSSKNIDDLGIAKDRGAKVVDIPDS